MAKQLVAEILNNSLSCPPTYGFKNEKLGQNSVFISP